MSARSDVLKIHRWLLELSMPVHLAMLTFALSSWMKALALVLGFPARIGPPLLVRTSFSLLVTAWPDFLPSLGYLLVLAIPALLLGGWVVRNAHPRT